ncbi:MAG: hypothetical protein SGI86_04775 [Deltaproteobacteria bacterium]|nr:hypothetical protein [Deltaproteobacteria bacterium]
MKKLLATLALSLIAVPLTANAAGEQRYNLSMPASTCHHTGAMQPYAATGIGNWTGVPQVVSCPIPTETDATTTLYNTSITTNAGVSVIDCTLRVVQTSLNGQSAWVFWPNATAQNWQSGFGYAAWQNITLPASSATAITCTVPNNQTVWHYNARSNWTQQI